MVFCQFVFLFVLFDLENYYYIFLLWVMWGIVRIWWFQFLRGVGSFWEDSVVLFRVFVFVFVCMDVSSNFKFQFFNVVFSLGYRQWDCFWYWDFNLGINVWEILDGLVEIFWFFFSGREDLDIFLEFVIFLNLRGDIGFYWLQFKFLIEIFFVVFILIDNISKKEYKLLYFMKELIIKYYFILSLYCGKCNINLRFLNKLIFVLKIDYLYVLVKVSSIDSDSFVKRIWVIVGNVLWVFCRWVFVEDMVYVVCKFGLKVDEDCEECQKVKDWMERIIRKIKDLDVYRRDELRLQGDFWRKVV